MVRGIIFYLLIWFIVAAALYVLGKLRRSQRMTLLRCFLYGLGTASLALFIVILLVNFF